MHKRSKIILAVFLTLGVAGTAVAFHKHRHHQGNFANHIEKKLTHELQLTPLQAEALKDMRIAIKQSRKAIQGGKVMDLREMLGLLEDEQFDQTKAMHMVKQRLTTIEEQAQELILSLSGFANSLAPDQKSKLKQLVEKRMHHRHSRHNEKHNA